MKGRLHKRDRAREPVVPVGNRFSGALNRLVGDLKQTAGFRHAQTMGVAREGPVRDFLAESLPGRFRVVSGEIVDHVGGFSPQIDLIVYNAHRNAALFSAGAHILPAEAALATVEVKTRLTADELDGTLAAAAKLKGLRPGGVALAARRERGAPDDGAPRYLHCVFAYNTDLAEGDDWAEREQARYEQVAAKRGVPVSTIDRIYVADRGLLMPADRLALREDRQNGQALAALVLHVLNFCAREDQRRAPVDLETYAGVRSQQWIRTSASRDPA